MDDDNSPTTEVKEQLISSFTEITSSSREEGRIFLEANEWNLDAAVSNFNKPEVAVASAEPNTNVPNPSEQPLLDARTRFSNLRIEIPDLPVSPPSQTVRRAGNIRKLADISGGTTSGSGQEVKSWEESSRAKSRSLKDIYASTPELITCDLTIWKNGYTIDDEGILSRFDIWEDAVALEFIEGLKSPRKLHSPRGKTVYTLKIIRRPEEDFIKESSESSQAESDDDDVSSESTNTASPAPSMELVIDPSAPTTLIEISFAGGSSITSQFNIHHTVRDIRGFIDSSRPDASRDYQLFIMETPQGPRPLTDLDQTIEEAAIADSILIHKY